MLKKIIVSLVVIFLSFNNICLGNDIEFSFVDYNNSEDVLLEVFKNDVRNASPRLLSGSAIVMDTISKRILYEKDAFVKRPMASTTKIMTAIIAVEKCSLNSMVTISKKAADVGGSNIHLKKDQKVRMEDLLYGLMLSSGNDAAIAIAEHIGGSVEKFAELMNNKAKQIGAFDTSFVTPHGLDKYNHYSTAYDMALIANYALKNEVISTIVKTKERTIELGNGVKRTLKNTNEMLYGYEGADGVKTGFTGMAGRCLVTSATRDRWKVISVVLGSSTKKIRTMDSRKLLNYAFENYTVKDLTKILPIDKAIDIKKAYKGNYNLMPTAKLVLPIKNDELDRIKIKYNVKNSYVAPIYKSSILGEAQYIVDSQVLGTVNLTLKNTIYKRGSMGYLRELFETFMKIKNYDIIN